MKKYLAFFSFVGCFLLFNLKTQAQFIQGADHNAIRVYTIKTLEMDSSKIYKAVLYAISDSTLIVVDEEKLKSAIKDWKSTNGDLLPPAEELTKLIEVCHIPYTNLQWVKISKTPKGLVGLGLGAAAATVAIIASAVIYGGEGAFNAVVVFTLPSLLLGSIIGGIVLPPRKLHRQSGINFKEYALQKWHKYTIVAQLQKIYPSTSK
ncbi:MAG: hypothetical protein R2822_10075 [Spirosomataceae bacterium]